MSKPYGLFKSFDTYSHYAEVYDVFKGDRQNTARLLASLIRQYNPDAKEILELACGTGAIIEGLAADYEVDGLDQSPAMLKIAKKKMPNTIFYKQDMAKLKLAKRYDVIYCIHNSVNHLTRVSEWRQFFNGAANHLAPEGILILGISTSRRMERLAALPVGCSVVDDSLVIRKVVKKVHSPDRYDWHIQIIEDYLKKPTLHTQKMEILTRSLDEIAADLPDNIVPQAWRYLEDDTYADDEVYVVFKRQ